MTRPPDEHSPSGAPVYEHGPDDRRERPARARGPARDALRAHVERHLGPIARVLEDPAPELVHVDLWHMEPAAGRNYHAFVTAGASDRAQRTPADKRDASRVELFLGLPPDWPLTEEGMGWPLELLRTLGRFPHRFRTWLAWGHTVPNGDPPRPYAPDTSLVCAYLREPRLLEPEQAKVDLPDGQALHLLAVAPIDAGELAYKLERGAAALELLLRRADVTELLDPERPSAMEWA